MNTSRFSSRLAAVLLLLALGPRGPLAMAEASQPADAQPNPFFAYCVGYGVGPQTSSLAAQLELPAMLQELGYAGMAYVGLEGVTEMLAALEQHRQTLFAVYTPLVVDPDAQGYDPRLKEVIPQLRGHNTKVWLVVNSKTYQPSTTDGDERAVTLLREIADLAGKSGVSVSLYPHRGAYAERMEDVVRLVRKADRPNLGVTFTFCHFLAVDQADNLERVLEMSRPYLTMVVINGTSGYDPQNRAGWIQTLDQGTFDLSRVLTALRKLDYRGPIGWIAFGIKGDRRDLLARSIQAWRSLSAQAAAGSE